MRDTLCLAAAVTGGLLARQLRNLLHSNIPPPPEEAAAAVSTSSCFAAPPLDDALAWPLLDGGDAHAVVVPELRVPAAPFNVAAWAAGALCAQIVTMLFGALVTRFRGVKPFHVRRLGTNHIEFVTRWRGGGRPSSKYPFSKLIKHGSPSARRMASEALTMAMRTREAALVVVNL